MMTVVMMKKKVDDQVEDTPKNMSNITLIEKSDDLLNYICGIKRRALLLIEQSNKLSHRIKLLQSYNNSSSGNVELSDMLSCRARIFVIKVMYHLCWQKKEERS